VSNIANSLGSNLTIVGMVHENQNDEWCDIKIYSLTEDQLKAKLEEYEDKVVNMWEVFND